ncbi:GNAT family N-acetyltransferase [Spirosoma areae]
MFSSLIAELDQDLLKRYGPKQSQYDVHNKGLEGASVVVAFNRDEPVGCACFKVVEPPNVVEIKRMYVQPSSRQLGVAQQLLAELERWAKETGHSKAILQTAIKQPEAIALYQKCGYQSIDCYGAYLGDTDSVCMKKEL